MNKNDLLVLTFLKSHFSKSDKPVVDLDISIPGLDILDISESIDYLNSKGYINVLKKHILNAVISIN